MNNDCFDEALDRYLAGRPVSRQAATLVAFADDVRAVAARPVRPSPQLARLLTEGLVGACDAAAIEAVPVPRAPSASRHRRRRRTVFAVLTAAAARMTSAGALPQGAMGLGIVVACVTGAGAAGVLPGPVQDEVSAVLEAVTPFDVPDSADDTAGTEEEPGTQAGGDADTEEAQDGGSPAETPAQGEFGRQVSEDAQSGDVAGQDVSERARATPRPGVPTAQAPQQRATDRPPAVHSPDQEETRGSASSPAPQGSSANTAPGRP